MPSAVDALCDLRVSIHVHGVVEIDEIVPQSLTKNEPSDHNQSEADIQRCESQRGAFSNRLLKNSSVFFLDLFLLMLIAERVLPKRQASAIKQKVLFETSRQVGLPLHGSYGYSLLRHREGV